jgi:hypothetical protein
MAYSCKELQNTISAVHASCLYERNRPIVLVMYEQKARRSETMTSNVVATQRGRDCPIVHPGVSIKLDPETDKKSSEAIIGLAKRGHLRTAIAKNEAAVDAI